MSAKERDRKKIIFQPQNLVTCTGRNDLQHCTNISQFLVFKNRNLMEMLENY